MRHKLLVPMVIAVLVAVIVVGHVIKVLYFK